MARKASYVAAHQPASGDPTIVPDPATELSVNHYRYPPKGFSHHLVRDSELALEYSSIIKQELRQSSFTIDDVDVVDFSCATKSSQMHPSYPKRTQET